MENRNGYRRQKSALWRSFRDGDFEEEDVWAVLKERRDSNYSKVVQSFGIESPFQVQRSIPSAARMIPRASSSSSNSTDVVKQQQPQQQSAPIKIPDWSNISNKSSKKKAHNKNKYHDDSDDDDDHYHHGVLDGDGDGGGGDEDEDDGYDCKVPPHEFIAERLAKSQIPRFSVFEGVGRTLKGRDLSKVRNAVLTKTGFLE